MNDTEGVLLGIAMVLVMMNVVMILWDRDAYFAALWRILTLQGLGILLRRMGITRKPKQEKARLLSLPELAAIEIECGMEPSWTPPLAVPSGVWTAIPGTDLEVWQDTGNVCAWAEGQGWLGLTRKRQQPVPPDEQPRKVPALRESPRRPRRFFVDQDCEDCEFHVVQSHGGSFSLQHLSEPCPKHQAMLRDAQEAR